MRKHGNRLASMALVMALGTVLAGCAKAPPVSQAQPAAAGQWTTLVDEWVESDLKANPNSATYLGRHDYDGQFPDWSEAGLGNEIQRLKDFRARAAAIDARQLDAAATFERDYLYAVIDGRLFWLETADWPHRNPTWYYFDPGVYLDRPYGDLPRRMKDYTRWASNLPAAAAQVKANLKGPLPKAYIDIGMHTFGPLSAFLKTMCGVDVAAARRVRQTECALRLADLQKHMESLRATQVENSRAVREDDYANERVRTPLAELEQMGLADMKRNQAALRSARTKAAASKPDRNDTVDWPASSWWT
jgi:hypothetical protein